MSIALKITDTGSALIAGAATSGTSVAVQRAAFGTDGTVHTTASATLGSQVGAFTVEKITKSGSNVTFTLTIPASWGGYTIREVGLLTSSGQLLAVGNVSDFYKPAAGPNAFPVQFSATLTVSDPATIASEVEGVVEGVNANLPAVQAFRDETEAFRDEAEGFRDQTAAYRVATGVDKTASETAKSQAEAAQAASEEWANADEDSLISDEAGGDGVDDYSAKHHAAKAGASATAAAGSAAVAVSASAASVNPKAFAGGVTFTDDNGTFYVPVPSSTFGDAKDFSVSGRVRVNKSFVGQQGMIWGSYNGSGSQGWALFVGTTGTLLFYYYASDTGLTSRQFANTPNFHDGIERHVTAVADRSDDWKLFIDGVPQTPTGGTALGARTGSMSQGSRLTVSGYTYGSSNRFIGSVGDLVVCNRTLSDSDAAEIYNQGLGWIFANPKSMWGNFGNRYNRSAFASGASDWAGLTGAVYAVNQSAGAETQLLQMTRGSDGRFNFTGFAIPSFGSYVLKTRVYVPSGQTGAVTAINVSVRDTLMESFPLLEDTWTEIEVEVRGQTTSSDNVRFSFSGMSEGDSAYLSELYITERGCIAALPMDEGAGYQLHDLSPHHYDALLPESGFEHLKPKREGFIRAASVDGTVTGYLLAAQSILSESTVVPGIIIDGQPRALDAVEQNTSLRRIRILANGGGSVSVQRSDGSTHQTLLTVSPTAAADFDINLSTQRI